MPAVRFSTTSISASRIRSVTSRNSTGSRGGAPRGSRGGAVRGSTRGSRGVRAENRGAGRCEDLSEDQQLNHVDLYLEKIKRKSLTMVLIEKGIVIFSYIGFVNKDIRIE